MEDRKPRSKHQSFLIPWSSFVGKKDATIGIFYVNYCSSNAVTTNDHFPIPAIDKLLNELGLIRVHIFQDQPLFWTQSNQGVALDDTPKTTKDIKEI